MRSGIDYKAISPYMAGYGEVEIDYRMAEKTFVRDVIGLDEAERNNELQELYESLRKLANGINTND